MPDSSYLSNNCKERARLRAIPAPDNPPDPAECGALPASRPGRGVEDPGLTGGFRARAGSFGPRSNGRFREVLLLECGPHVGDPPPELHPQRCAPRDERER